MFKIKNKSADKNNIATDFKMRSPFGTYRPVDYKEYAPFVNLKPALDGHLEKLFAGDLDEGNKDALNPLINDMAAKAEQDLNRQKVSHTESINNFYNRHVADKLAFEKQREQLKAALEENEQELEEVGQRYNVNKF